MNKFKNPEIGQLLKLKLDAASTIAYKDIPIIDIAIEHKKDDILMLLGTMTLKYCWREISAKNAAGKVIDVVKYNNTLLTMKPLAFHWLKLLSKDKIVYMPYTHNFESTIKSLFVLV